MWSYLLTPNPVLLLTSLMLLMLILDWSLEARLIQDALVTMIGTICTIRILHKHTLHLAARIYRANKLILAH